MDDVAATLLPDVKIYLGITWQDDDTDKKVTGYINRGMKRLQKIAGATLDFTQEDLPKTLLLDYCRYANSQALEVFEHNFLSELLDLNFNIQAPIINDLVPVILPNSVSGNVYITTTPILNEHNGYVYIIGAALTLPTKMDVCKPDVYTYWDGFSPIAAVNGQDILIIEVNDEYKAVCAGKVTVNL